MNCPASLSISGKRERHFFKTRDLAKAHATALREKSELHGKAAVAITPALAEDATLAEAVLKPLGASLLTAAWFFAAARKRDAQSKPLAAAVAAWLASCEGLRDRTLSCYGQTAKRLTAELGDKVLAGITADELQAAVCPLGSVGSSAAGQYRNARAFWKWAAGKKWCDATIFDQVESPRVNRDGEIEILTPEQAETLLRIAENNFPQAVPNYALQLFAGIRAEEITKLELEHVRADGIDLPSTVAKKRRRRHIVPSPTLAAWLERFPFAPCSNWKRVDRTCRHLAGWDVAPAPEFYKPPAVKPGKKPLPRPAWPQNCLRHSHATYAIASGVPLADLLFEFGHVGGEAVLRTHYVGRSNKKDALAFFAIVPTPAKGQKAKKIQSIKIA
ncbi:MAG: hypothetical protein WCO57_04880 [Verrucomicrobiota bacterium]